ncbi:diacylglycerol/lipid kinase family protein [Rubripirellula reticaptiva]|uniref:Diacylglycerol kinase n=1 Tax=Rubripirellula reticaptiva TaxID=2528013 RepID=A0A5C6F2E2_9BACT|nr:diacylglycerol kinase family protein [Rubripirellula reticaptiva]TWU55372.1 Diacylglycerol kinase [Rubripirellula reticaptiva]
MNRLDPKHATSVIIFTSPKAGSGAGRDQLPKLTAGLQQIGIDVQTVGTVIDLQTETQRAHNPIVVAAGGDGTLALAAASIAAKVPLVPMPMGTENLLAKHFGYRCDAAFVIETLQFGQAKRIDVGTAAGKPFLIMATCGFDAEVVRAMHLTRRGHINRFSYFRPISRAISRYRFPEIQIRVDGAPPIRAGWAMVFNLPRYAASLAIEPNAIPDDGMLDLIALQGRSVARGLVYLAGIQTGQHLKFSDVVRLRGKSFEISASDSTGPDLPGPETPACRIPYQVDGDYAGRLPLKIETMPGRVQLLLPSRGIA